MKTVKNSGLAVAICLLLTGCVPDVGNPNLAGSWSCTETSEIFLKSTTGTSGEKAQGGAPSVNAVQRGGVSAFAGMTRMFSTAFFRSSRISLPHLLIMPADSKNVNIAVIEFINQPIILR